MGANIASASRSSNERLDTHTWISDDGRKLFRDYGILAANLVELGGLARAADPSCSFTRSIVALAKVVETYTGKVLDKGKVRSSDWEHVPLSEEQLECKPYVLNFRCSC